jgi:hypothetical protein
VAYEEADGMPSVRTRRKRKLGQFLDGLRAEAGVEVDTLAGEIRKSQPSASKYLNGYLLIGWSDLNKWLDLLGATDEQRSKAHEMWEDAKQDSKRVEHPAAYNLKARAFARAEADASSVRTIESLGVPGLLQTAAYAEAVRKSAHLFVNPSVNARRAAAAQVSRQKNLYGPAALQYHALIDEAVVRRVAGSLTVAHEQLVHLLDMSALPNVTIQVIDRWAGTYGTMSGGGTTILGFEDEEDPDAVYLEFSGGGVWVEDEDDVKNYVDSFAEVVGVALSPEESAKYIRSEAEALREIIEDDKK